MKNNTIMLEKLKTCYRVRIMYKNKRYSRYFQEADQNMNHHNAAVFKKSLEANVGEPVEYLFNKFESRQLGLIPITMAIVKS